PVTLDRREFVAAVAASAAIRLPQASRDDPLGVRDDFPITQSRVFLNSAYIAPIPRPVVDAGTAFLTAKSTRPLEVGELIGTDDRLRGQFARLINATPGEVALLCSTAEGENTLAQGLDLQRGDNVVVDELHYPTEFVLYRALEASRGIELRIVPHRGGAVDASDSARYVDTRT